MKKAIHQKFWMVWSPKGRAPTVRHYTADRARNEAMRLATLCPTHEFYVLKAVSGVTARPPKITSILLSADADPDLRIPF